MPIIFESFTIHNSSKVLDLVTMRDTRLPFKKLNLLRIKPLFCNARLMYVRLILQIFIVNRLKVLKMIVYYPPVSVYIFVLLGINRENSENLPIEAQCSPNHH